MTDCGHGNGNGNGNGRHGHQPPDTSTDAPQDPHAKGGPLDRHWSRTDARSGTEPVTARSALRIRLILASLFTPLFLAGTALFWYWMTQTGPGDAPGVGSLRTLTVICGVLALFSIIDLTAVLLRRKHRRTPAAGRGPARFSHGHRSSGA